MKIQRFGQLAGITLAGSLALSACGSDNNTDTSGGTGAAAAGAAECAEGTLNAEGSSAQKNAIEEAIASFQDACEGATVNYNPTGSGAGIKQFIAGQVDFAGSDSALKTEEKDGKVETAEAEKPCGSPAWNLPMVTGPIAIAYNVAGCRQARPHPRGHRQHLQRQDHDLERPGHRRSSTLASSCRARRSRSFFRSDESGTTENFTKYLDGRRARRPGPPSPARAGPARARARRSPPVSPSAVQSTEGGITYVEWSYAKDNKLGIAQIDNGAGPVELTGETVGKAVATAKHDGEGNDLRLKLDYATKEAGRLPDHPGHLRDRLLQGHGPGQGRAHQGASSSTSPSDETQAALEEIGYAPLPDEVRTKVATAIDALS